MDEPTGAAPAGWRSPVEAGLALLAVGLLFGLCLRALAPFLNAILWAAILAVTGWPLVATLQRRLHCGRAFAALVLACGFLVVLAFPLLYFIITSESAIQSAWTLVAGLDAKTMGAPPAFLVRIPLIGAPLDALWNRDVGALQRLIGPHLVEHAQNALLVLASLTLGQLTDLLSALADLLFGILLAGQALAAGTQVRDALHRVAIALGGAAGLDALSATGRAIEAVALGVIGGAIVEATLSGIGFWVGGVILAPLLAFACFVLRVLQIGPWPIWIAAVAWLWWAEDAQIAAMALAVWLAVLVSGANRLLRPLISHRSSLPRPVLFLAVLGGLLAWGFSGMFLGAAAVTVAWTLTRHWLRARAPAAVTPAE